MGFMLLVKRHRLPRAPRDLAALALFSIFGVVINQVCFVEGLARTTTSHSAIINTSIPVATLLFAILMGRERATGRKLAGIALSLGGVLYLIGHSGVSLGGTIVAGDLLTMANATSFSFFLVISKPILSRHSSLAVTAELFVFGAAGIAMLGGRQVAALDFGAISPGVWGVAALIVLFPTAGAYILNAWALKRVEASTVALFIYLQPLIASVLAASLLGEPLGRESAAAALLIFAGLALATARGPAAAEPELP
jgi:drug/metabolite transporter (DMT)-like permease